MPLVFQSLISQAKRGSDNGGVTEQRYAFGNKAG
jgi:hypothetical protein